MHLPAMQALYWAMWGSGEQHTTVGEVGEDGFFNWGRWGVCGGVAVWDQGLLVV